MRKYRIPNKPGNYELGDFRVMVFPETIEIITVTQKKEISPYDPRCGEEYQSTSCHKQPDDSGNMSILSSLSSISEKFRNHK